MNNLEFNDEDELVEPLKPEARRELALEMSALMDEPIDFDIGDFVVWKSRSLRNRGFPLLDEPVLVVKINEQYVRHPTDDADAPEFREPLGLVLGYIDEHSAIYHEYHADARRFRLWVPPDDGAQKSGEVRLVKSMCGVHMYEHTCDGGEKIFRVGGCAAITKYRDVADAWFADAVQGAANG